MLVRITSPLAGKHTYLSRFILVLSEASNGDSLDYNYRYVLVSIKFLRILAEELEQVTKSSAPPLVRFPPAARLSVGFFTGFIQKLCLKMTLAPEI